jgi:hypothetical protein
MKSVRVVLSPEAEEVYNYLNKEAPKSKNRENNPQGDKPEDGANKAEPTLRQPNWKKANSKRIQEKIRNNKPLSCGAAKLLENALLVN